jgi:MYXO-CTERM domain-containing protein
VDHTAAHCCAPVLQRCSLGILLVAAVGACSDAHDGTSGEPVVDRPTLALAGQAGVQEGEFVTYVADFDDGHSERWYALRQSDGREFPLTFDRPPGLVTGTHVRVQGEIASIPATRTPRETTNVSLRVSAIEPTFATDRVESTNPVTWPLASSETYALVLVNLGSGVNVTTAQGQTAMFSTNAADKSFAAFYYESSNGKYSVSGDVVGPFNFTMTTCDTTGMYQQIEPMVTATKTYNHYIYYFTKSSLCTFGGLGEEGSVAMPAKRTWMNGSLGCVVLMQEPGHNLGLMHANTMSCSGASFAATPSSSCTITEYGSPWTPMGSGCHQLNGYEKWYEQWLTGCNGVRVNATGTFNLVPLGMSCPGAVQVLQVPMPATRTVSDPQSTNTTVNLKDYYVELRAPAGTFDQYSTGGRGGGFTQPTVTVYASDDVHPGTSVGRGGGGNSVWTELLNMNPSASTTTYAGLQVGVPFSDPSGSPTITLQSIGTTGATVSVTIQNGTGGSTCIDGTMLTGSGTSCDGGAVVIPPLDAGAPEAAVIDAAPEANAGAMDARSPATADAQSGSSSGAGTGTNGGQGSPSDAGSVSKMPGAALGSTADADPNADWAQAAAAPTPACACRSVGAGGGGPRNAWLGVSAFVLIGLRSRSRQARKSKATFPRTSNDA